MPAGGRMPGAGRKPFVPTATQRREVELLTAAGMHQDMICKQITDPKTGKPISVRTLRNKFKTEISYGLDKMVGEVAKSLFQKATGNGKNAISAAIFILKCRGGWRETPMQIEHSGPNQGPILTGAIDPNDAQEAYLKMIQGR